MDQVNKEGLEKAAEKVLEKESVEVTEKVVSQVPYNPLFNLTENQEGISNRFFSGGSLDVIQVLEPFCEEQFPLAEKSMAFLVPYGFSSSTSTVTVPTTPAVPGENLGNQTSETSEQAQIGPNGKNAWQQGNDSKGKVEERTEEELDELSKKKNERLSAQAVVEARSAEDLRDQKVDVSTQNRGEPPEITVEGDNLKIRKEVLNEAQILINKIEAAEQALIKATSDYDTLTKEMEEEKQKVNKLLDNSNLSAAEVTDLQAQLNEVFNDIATEQQTFNTLKDTLVQDLSTANNNLKAFEEKNRDVLGLTLLSNGKYSSTNYRDALANGEILDTGLRLPVYGSNNVAVSSIPNFSGTFQIPQPEDLKTSPCGDYDFGGLVFLMNPESMNLGVRANYQTADTWGDIADAQALQWVNNENATLSLSEVQLPGFAFRRVVQPIVDEAFNLLLKPAEGTFEPRVWSFVWGKRRFEPCIVESVTVKETGWYQGRSVIASISISLKKVPRWQVNDGVDVIVYDPKLTNTPTESSVTGDTADDDKSAETEAATDSSTTTTDASEIDRTKFNCQKNNYLCSKKSAYQDFIKKTQFQNKSISRKDLKLAGYIKLCNNTANDGSGDKIDDTECNWDRCCRTFKGLIEVAEADAKKDGNTGTSLGEVSSADCGNISIEALTKRITDQVLPDVLSKINSTYRVEISSPLTVSKFKTAVQQKYDSLSPTQQVGYAYGIQLRILKETIPESGPVSGFFSRVAQGTRGGVDLLQDKISGRNINVDSTKEFTQSFTVATLVTPAMSNLISRSGSNPINLKGFGTQIARLIFGGEIAQDGKRADQALAKAAGDRQSFSNSVGATGQIIDVLLTLQTKTGMETLLGLDKLCKDANTEAGN